jgi:hypothetical protein
MNLKILYCSIVEKALTKTPPYFSPLFTGHCRSNALGNKFAGNNCALCVSQSSNLELKLLKTRLLYSDIPKNCAQLAACIRLSKFKAKLSSTHSFKLRPGRPI